MGRISKQGNHQLRTLLIHGTRSVVHAAAKKDDAFSLWVRELVARRGYNRLRGGGGQQDHAFGLDDVVTID